MATLFTKIIEGDIPCFKIAEDENYFAFLDINPLHLGHTLIVPKLEIDYIYDLPDNLISGINIFAKKIAKAIESVVVCERIGVAIIGLEVPHAHIHLIPINNVDDINFSRPKLKFSADEFNDIANKIRNKLTL